MKADIRSMLLVVLVPFVLVASTAIDVEFAVADDVPSAEAKSQSTSGDVDVDHSRVYAFVGKTGFGHEHGIAGRLKSGSIRLGASEKAGQLEFDLTSFVADTPEARRYVGLKGETDASTQEQVTTNMLGNYVLDTQQYPTATFAINSALPLSGNLPNGAKRYQLDGQFTLHGATRPVRIVAQAKSENGVIRLRGSFMMLQTDYNITPFTKALGAVGVTDKLRIYGDILIVPGRNRAAVDQ
ncbi:MAG TPA: YceI family protein [Planctomycetaceae bacterium]|jgi:polyisoprenoid-binding protein YceI|nr:YceI family protein [Planctomycetaceae bacterium]